MTDSFIRQHAAILAVAERGLDHVGWTEVCELLDQLADEVVRDYLDELELALQAWPAALRIAPTRWAARLRSAGREPRVRLCRVLRLAMTRARAELWRALDAEDVARIESLDLGYCELDEGTAGELAGRLARIGVTSLRLTGNPVGAGIVHVVRLSRGGALVSLDAESCRLAGAPLAAVAADGPILLRELGLGVNALTAQDVAQLARIPGLDRVRRLGLGGNELLASGVRVLAEQAPLGELRELDLEGARCGAEGAAALAAAPALAKLEELSLMGCEIGDAGAASLAAAPSLGALREPDLRRNRITAAGARALLTSAQLTALKRVQLTSNEIGDDIFDVLASSALVARLESLTLDDSHLSDEGRAAVQTLPVSLGVLDLALRRED
jgi:Leucine Rich repeat